MRKNARYVLVIGDDGTMLVPVDNRAQQGAIYAATRDDVARSQIRKELTQNAKARMVVVANSAAQEFRVEDLPQLNVLDRNKVVGRRLNQAFHDSYAAASRNMGPKHVVMAGLHKGGPVAGWCRNLPVKDYSLGSLPIEGAGMMRQLLPEAAKGWNMLLAHFKTGGLRQIVLHNGQLIFTRQTPGLFSEEKAKDAQEALQRVIEDTRGYLARFGLTADMDLRIALLASRPQQALLAKQKKVKHLYMITPRDAAERLHLSMAPDQDSGDADLVFAAWIASRGKLWLPMTPTGIRREKRDARIAQVGFRFGFAALVLAFCVVGLDAIPLAMQMYKNYQSEQNVADMRAALLARQAEQAPSEKPLGRLRAAFERQRLFTEPRPEPWDVLRQLAKEQDGKAHLTSFDWHDDHSLRVDLALDGDDVKGAERQVIVHNFKLLADHLVRMMPGYSIDVTRYPFPAMPQEAISNTGDTPAKDAPTASLMIRRRS